jgi:hypothetical protein
MTLPQPLTFATSPQAPNQQQLDMHVAAHVLPYLVDRRSSYFVDRRGGGGGCNANVSSSSACTAAMVEKALWCYALLAPVPWVQVRTSSMPCQSYTCTANLGKWVYQR